MTLVIIFGPPAVGKMTVGDALERLTGLRLFHNHMTIDLVLRFFGFGHPSFDRLVAEFRTRIFEEVAASDLPGLIFTYVWALDHPGDKRFIDGVTAIFRRRGAAVCFVEREARRRNGGGGMRRSSGWPTSRRSGISSSRASTYSTRIARTR